MCYVGQTPYLEHCLNSIEHVPELLFLFIGEGIHKANHVSGLEIGDSENILEKKFGVDQAGPGKHVD